jgi:spore germination protein YaaH
LQPHWFAEKGILDALAGGIDDGDLSLGLLTYSQQWPDRAVLAVSNSISYQAALALSASYGDSILWISKDANGKVEEGRAEVGKGVIWISDADVMKSRLDLADKHNLDGMMLFLLGEGDEGIWDKITYWKTSHKDVTGFVDPYGHGGLFGREGGRA